VECNQDVTTTTAQFSQSVSEYSANDGFRSKQNLLCKLTPVTICLHKSVGERTNKKITPSCALVWCKSEHPFTKGLFTLVTKGRDQSFSCIVIGGKVGAGPSSLYTLKSAQGLQWMKK
jgi:hypothetical protein